MPLTHVLGRGSLPCTTPVTAPSSFSSLPTSQGCQKFPNPSCFSQALHLISLNFSQPEGLIGVSRGQHSPASTSPPVHTGVQERFPFRWRPFPSCDHHRKETCSPAKAPHFLISTRVKLKHIQCGTSHGLKMNFIIEIFRFILYQACQETYFGRARVTYPRSFLFSNVITYF